MTNFVNKQTITRPANTTAYAAGDVVGGLITFQNMAQANEGNVVLKRASVVAAISAVPSGMTGFTLHLFSAPPATIADNAAFLLATAAAESSYLGSVVTGTIVDRGASLSIAAESLDIPLFLDSETIYCYMVTNGGFTPAAISEVYYLELSTEDKPQVETNFTASKSVTLPASPALYAAADVVGGLFTFANVCAAGIYNVAIKRIQLHLEVAAIPSAMDVFTLHLYTAAPQTLADNAAYALDVLDAPTYVGAFAFGSIVDRGPTLSVALESQHIPVTVGAGRALYAYLATNGSYTPAAGSEVYNLTLTTQN